MLAATVKAHRYLLDCGSQILSQLGYFFGFRFRERVLPFPTHEVTADNAQLALLYPRALQRRLNHFRLFHLLEAHQDRDLHSLPVAHGSDHRDVTVALTDRAARFSGPGTLVWIMLQARLSRHLL